MNSAARIAGSGLLASFLLSTTALAEVSARDVWESWRGYLGGFGYDISASEQTVGNTLTVSDVTLGLPLPEDEGSVSVTMGDLKFVEIGDGTVAIVMADKMPMQINTRADDETVDISLLFSHANLSTIVSGTPEEMTYAYNAAEIGVDLEKIVVNGAEIPDLVANAILAGILGTSTMSVGETVATTQKMSVDSLTYTFQGTDPAGSGEIDMQGSASGIEIDADAVIPLGDYADDPAALFTAGFDIAGSYSLQASEFDLTFVDEGAPGSVSSTSGGGSVALQMNDSVLAYGGGISDVQISAMGPDIPLPIDISFGELAFGFEMPLMADEAPQDFALNLTVADLGVSEMIWGMFDPGQVLPQDPATLIVELMGKATVFTDIMTLDEDSDEIPGELNALTLKDLQLRFAGASVTGKGDFVFDNSDMQSFDGLPRPEGALDLNITGLNGLLDKLVQMGLVPEEQVMGARMMLSMFSVPGDGEDTLNSRIEVNEQGHVLANGQRLK